MTKIIRSLEFYFNNTLKTILTKLGTPIKILFLQNRFLFSKGEFNKKSIKVSALLPMKNNTIGRFETSLYQSNPKDQLHLTKIQRRISKMREKSIKAHAEISSKFIDFGKNESNQLYIDPDIFPRYHSCIVGWPSKKSEQKLLAEKIILAIDSKKLEHAHHMNLHIY